MDFSIRALSADDAAPVAAIHVRSWQAAYRGLLDPVLLDSLGVEQRTDMWSAILSTPSEGARLLVEVDDEAVGFLVGARTSPTTEEAAEVLSIYLDPSVWRGGIGSALLDAGVAALRADRAGPVILWVLEGNEPACRFYESRGWRVDGGRKDERVGDQNAPHIRYRLD